MNINNRQQLLTIAAAVAVAFLVSDKLILSPLTKSWKARAARIVELRKSVTQGTQLLEREQAIRSRWESMRTNTLPSESSVAENQVLKAFDRWSQESQISITSIKTQGKRNADDYMTLECHVDGFGNLSTITRFLYNIENDPMALRVESVEISARDNDGQQLALILQVSGLLLSQAEQ
jgi:hypothetical protein